MNKRMRELKTLMAEKTAEAKKLLEGEEKDLDGASKLMDEVEELQKEYNLEKQIFEAQKTETEDGEPAADPISDENKSVETASQKFCKAVRSIVKGVSIPSENTGESGGYTVPEDIQTSVNRWAEAEFSFLSEIDVVPVTTNKGARTYQKKGDADVFVDLDESGAITGQIEAPKFERVTYTIQDRAGFMPVPNDLVNDSDANIISLLTQWLGRANVATSNAKILSLITSKAQQDFKNLKGIKKAINVTLGQAYKGGCKIYTNDDGLDFLDTLEDANGRPLLNPDPTAPQSLQLRCGTVVVPIKVVPNKIFASSGTKIPFIIGDLKSGIRKWDRQSMSIMASSTAVIGEFNAYASNMTLLRAILRDDYTLLDEDSFVYGYIDTSKASAAEE